VFFWREKFGRAAQEKLLHDVLAREKQAPFYRPQMPGSGKAFSVEETNFGPLGWVSDKSGYRYQPLHPVTGKPWSAMPEALTALWEEIAASEMAECCLVNLYRAGARMGCTRTRMNAHWDRRWCRCPWAMMPSSASAGRPGGARPKASSWAPAMW
jgi:alkylated DNA repair protein (DNA oxidative demethylase)